MADIIPFQPRERGTHVCTIELWRSPKGDVTGRLVEMPDDVIEEMGDPSDQMVRLAIWMEKASQNFLVEAIRLRENIVGDTNG